MDLLGHYNAKRAEDNNTKLVINQITDEQIDSLFYAIFHAGLKIIYPISLRTMRNALSEFCQIKKKYSINLLIKY